LLEAAPHNGVNIVVSWRTVIEWSDGIDHDIPSIRVTVMVPDQGERTAPAPAAWLGLLSSVTNMSAQAAFSSEWSDSSSGSRHSGH
jgi:hypothetical protein